MRRFDRGETFFNCLVVLVLVMGTAMWAWLKFGAHHDILQGGKVESVVIEGSDNRTARLRYSERMRERYFGTSAYAVEQAGLLVTAVRKGKYASDREAFEQRYYEVVRQLEDNLSELNANQVPAVFVDGHLKLGIAHRHCYEAVVICRLALSEEPELQKKHFKEAGGLTTKAAGEVRQGRQLLEANFR